MAGTPGFPAKLASGVVAAVPGFGGAARATTPPKEVEKRATAVANRILTREIIRQM